MESPTKKSVIREKIFTSYMVIHASPQEKVFLNQHFQNELETQTFYDKEFLVRVCLENTEKLL